MNKTLFLIKPTITKGDSKSPLDFDLSFFHCRGKKDEASTATELLKAAYRCEPVRDRRFNEEQGIVLSHIKVSICSNPDRVSLQTFYRKFECNLIRRASALGCAARCAHTYNADFNSGCNQSYGQGIT